MRKLLKILHFHDVVMLLHQYLKGFRDTVVTRDLKYVPIWVYLTHKKKSQFIVLCIFYEHIIDI